MCVCVCVSACVCVWFMCICMWHRSIIHTPSYRILHGGIEQHDDHSKETMDRLGVPQKLEHVRDKDYHMLKEDIHTAEQG